MTLRIWTYQTLDAAGEPVAAGTGYDLEIFDLDAKMSNNFIIQTLRDGRDLTMHDTKIHYEVKGVLSIPTIYIDEQSVIQYLGDWRYLAANFYHHYKYHDTITLFLRGINNSPPKAYVCYLTDLPVEIAAQATLDDTTQMHFSRQNAPLNMKFGLEITLSGAWSDWNDVTSVVWESRT